MWNETVTLYIDDTSIRLLVSQGQRIKKWADLHLEPGLIKGSIVADEGGVATRIKKLLQDQNVNTRKVILGFSGLHSLTRPATLPQLPKAMLAEAVAREARRVLPVPLDQLYLSWRAIPGSKERIQVFMVATPRKIADSLIQTLRSAGLEPSYMVIKPLALTKALTIRTAILIDAQPGEFDIIIVSEGIPQPIRSVTFPEEELSWEQKLNMITSDLDRTIKFFDTNNPEKPLHPSVPIYVSGELIGQPELYKDLSEKSGHPVQVLAPTLKGPEQIELGRYVVNVVMAMKTSAFVEAAFPVANLNLLPAPYQPKPVSLTKVLGIPGGLAVAGLVVPMVMMIQNTSSNIATIQSQLDSTNQAINQKTAQMATLKKSVTDLQTQAAAVQKTYNNLNLALNVVTTHQEYVNGDLALVLGKLMPSITLKSINETEGILTVNGTAPNQQDIYTYSQAILQYARTLDSSGRYVETTVASLKATTPQNNNPTSNNNQQNDTNQGNIGTQESQPDGTIEFTLTFERKGK